MTFPLFNEHGTRAVLTYLTSGSYSDFVVDFSAVNAYLSSGKKLLDISPMTDTRQKIIETARGTVQELGYSGLSFRELAKDVGIKSASIHYYFATKGELVQTIARNYTDDFSAYLESVLDQDLSFEACMQKYTDYFANTLRTNNRMCLAGILAAERNEVPAEVRTEVVRFGEMNQEWIAKAMDKTDPKRFPNPAQTARAFFAAVWGAQLLAHSHNDITIFDEIVSTYRSSSFIP